MIPNEGVSDYRSSAKLEKDEKRCKVRPVLKRPGGEDWTVVLHNTYSLLGGRRTSPIADMKLGSPFSADLQAGVA